MFSDKLHKLAKVLCVVLLFFLLLFLCMLCVVQDRGWRSHHSIHYALPCGRSHRSLWSFKSAKKSFSVWKYCYFLIQVSTSNLIHGTYFLNFWIIRKISNNYMIIWLYMRYLQRRNTDILWQTIIKLCFSGFTYHIILK